MRTDPSRASARHATRALAVATLMGFLSAACAWSGSERHVAPLYTEIARGGGGVEVEALGGAWRKRYATIDGPWTQWAVRPIVIEDRTVEGHVLGRFFTPFGTLKDRGDDYVCQLLPVTRYERRITADGEREWTLLTLPGIYWARKADGRILRGWFPFGGVMEDFLSFDRLVWVLWPIYMRSERDGRVTDHFLFPIFAWTDGRGGPSGRVWPLFGISKYEGRYDRRFWLWPVFNYSEEDLGKASEGFRWAVFPLLAHEERGSYQSTSVLWPFFGFADDPKTHFWAWDGPWPFVRILRSPKQEIFETRLWPFYSHFQGDGLDSRWFLWPIFNHRHEVYPEFEKVTTNLVPFWQSWSRNDEVAGRSTFHKLWPLYKAETRVDDLSFAFPALNPMWQTADIDEMYGWIWELYTREVTQGIVRERSWLGLWRREKDANEDRKSISCLWARRKWRDGGVRVRDTSLLFGLVRWRSRDDDGFEMLAPAFPGPGWPLERASDAASLGADGSR